MTLELLVLCFLMMGGDRDVLFVLLVTCQYENDAYQYHHYVQCSSG